MEAVSAALDETHLCPTHAQTRPAAASPDGQPAAGASVEKSARAHAAPHAWPPCTAAAQSSAAAPPLRLSASEWLAAAGAVQPATLAGVATSRAALASTRWRDVGGLRRVKRRLRMIVQWPLRAPMLCASLGLGGPRGILLYGPPGTGGEGGGSG
eukprot:scaffold23597_cov76-Isochrysis_galbana.AAC.1